MRGRAGSRWGPGSMRAGGSVRRVWGGGWCVGRGVGERLEAVNRERQDVEAAIMETAMRSAEAQVAAGHAVVVVAGDGWHPGVVGIVAGRVKERFNRPARVAAVVDGVAKGSGRSVAGLDLGSAIIAARQTGMLLT